MHYSLNLKLLYNNKKFFGPGVASLLELVKEYGSLRKASNEMGMAYSKAFKMIHCAEEVLGFKLLISKAGGVGGGGAMISEQGEEFLSKYKCFEKDCYSYSDKLFKHYFPNNK